MKNLSKLALAGVLAAISSTAQAAPLPTTASVQFGDFQVYSLPYLEFLTGTDYTPRATGNAVNSLPVLGAGTAGGPRVDNADGMDNAYVLPQGTLATFSTATAGDPGGAGEAFGGIYDTGVSWDASATALRSYLSEDPLNRLVFYFSFNEGNGRGTNDEQILPYDQDLLAYATVKLIDASDPTATITRVLSGSATPGGTYLFNFETGVAGPSAGSVNAAYVHAEVCGLTYSNGTNDVFLGRCSDRPDTAGVTETVINQALGTDEATFALYNADIDTALRTNLDYDFLQVSFSFGDITGGREQAFILGTQFAQVPPPVETPEPAALGILGLGILGVAAARRRKA